jgi:glycine cleavage system aminomethyltransferase T
MTTYHYDLTNNQWLNENGDVIDDPRVTPIDHFINQQRQDLHHLEFDDPEFDVVNQSIIDAYAAIARGETHIVHF